MSSESTLLLPGPRPPRVLRVDLGRPGEASSEAFESEDAALVRTAGWGGSALALALLTQASDTAPPPFVVAVGPCVERGVPTAARATVAARAPLSGGLAEGQIGGELAARLARVASALVLTGRAESGAAVLVIDGDGRVRLEERSELCGLDPNEKGARLSREFGASAILCTGPAGERGVRFATLVSAGEHTSHVGRGGLGAVFGAMGLLAIVVTAEPIAPSASEGASKLVRTLTESPRLRARSEGGTLELWQAFGARGDLSARNYTEKLDADAAGDLWNETNQARRERHGCRGCPTPCGWVFERETKAKQGAHFGAAWAVGPNLGLERFDDALALLAACDREGMDAKEAGAVLALIARAERDGVRFGDRASLERALARIVERADDPSFGSHGASFLARELRLEDEHFAVRDQAARPESDLASVLGQCVSAGGTDPMRSFPFTTAAGLARSRVEAVVGDLPLPERAEDPRDPAGKGRLVWWHENLVAAIDASGFCAFSAGGLLADGVTTLDELAVAVAPELEGSRGAARELLGRGASLVLLRRQLVERWRPELGDDTPTWAAERLALPGMLDEYRELRGLDERGVPTADARRGLATAALVDGALEACRRQSAEEHLASSGSASSSGSPFSARDANGEPAANGRVCISGMGSLREQLAGAEELELPLLATLREVLQLLGERAPAISSVVTGDAPLVSVWREGRALFPDDRIESGDRLELLLAVAGG